MMPEKENLKARFLAGGHPPIHTSTHVSAWHFIKNLWVSFLFCVNVLQNTCVVRTCTWRVEAYLEYLETAYFLMCSMCFLLICYVEHTFFENAVHVLGVIGILRPTWRVVTAMYMYMAMAHDYG